MYLWDNHPGSTPFLRPAAHLRQLLGPPVTVVITIGTAITSIVLHRLLYRWPCVPRINRRFSLSFDGYLLIICATVMVERWPSEPYVRLDAVFSSLVRNILPSTCTRREGRTRSPRSNSSVQGPSSNSILWAVREDLIPPPFSAFLRRIALAWAIPWHGPPCSVEKKSCAEKCGRIHSVVVLSHF